MSLEITVGPPRLAINQGHSVLITDPEISDLRIGEEKFDLRFWRDGERTGWEVLKGSEGAIVPRSFASAAELPK
jgi:hypothetical protein